MAVLTILMCFVSTDMLAQLKEVRGVQTRVVKYEKNDNKKILSDGAWGTTIHGFEFKNENNYAVWVDAELCTNGFGYKWNGNRYELHVDAGTYDTKSFTLNAGETYVWKCGDKMIYEGDKDFNSEYYVKYKAYKAE